MVWEEIVSYCGWWKTKTHTPQPHPWTLRRDVGRFKRGDSLHFRLLVHREDPSVSTSLDLCPRLLVVKSCNGPLDKWTCRAAIRKCKHVPIESNATNSNFLKPTMFDCKLQLKLLCHALNMKKHRVCVSCCLLLYLVFVFVLILKPYSSESVVLCLGLSLTRFVD